MKKTICALFLCLCAASLTSKAQEIIKRKGYTLSFENNDPAFDPAVKKRLIKTFFKVYPKLAKEYNPATKKEVRFVVDTAYKGVAATGGGRIVFNPAWFKKHPGDIDVVTHEVMHVVQNYGRSAGPGWLTEGIADYVRYKFGVDNKGANWSLTPFKESQSYTNSYRITARFLNWLETSGHAGIVKQLDQQLRDHTFTQQSWATLAGKPLDDLWADYIKFNQQQS